MGRNTGSGHLFQLALQQCVDLVRVVDARPTQLLVVHAQLRHQLVKATLERQQHIHHVSRIAQKEN